MKFQIDIFIPYVFGLIIKPKQAGIVILPITPRRSLFSFTYFKDADDEHRWWIGGLFIYV